jgi:hypothetical protein
MGKILTKIKKFFGLIKEFVSRKKVFILTIFIVGLIDDFFFNPQITGWLVLLLVAIWLMNVVLFKLKSKHHLLLAFMAYLFALLSQFGGQELMAEKAASWLFIFLAISFTQGLREKGAK